MTDSYRIAKKVLDYWFTTEFLAQETYPSLSFDNSKAIVEAKNGSSNRNTLQDFLQFRPENIDDLYDAISSELNTCGMTCLSNLTFYLGKE